MTEETMPSTPTEEGATDPTPPDTSIPDSDSEATETFDAPTSNDVGEQTLTAADREALEKSSNVTLPPAEEAAPEEGTA